MLTESLRCSTCGEDKHPQQFHVSKQLAEKGLRGGRAYSCVECVRATKREAYRRSERYKGAYQPGDAPKRKSKKELNRESALRRMYGIGVDEYQRMLEDQDFKCAICGGERTGHTAKSNFCVDHDHETGKVRGLLCAKCNSGIGYLKDDPALVRSALEYLEYHNVGS